MKSLILFLFFPLLANAAGKIIDADVAASGTANIARNKLAAGTAYAWCTNDVNGYQTSTAVTASQAVATDANGVPVASSTTATELGYVHGVTSAIQTQINGKQATISTSSAPSHQYCTGFTAPNTFTYAQPASSDLSDASNIDLLNAAQTYTAAKTNSTAGAASTPAMTFSGTPYSAGTSTTNRPQVILEWGSPTTNNWSTAGTAFGINAASAFTGNILDLQLNAAKLFTVDHNGAVLIGAASAPQAYPTLGIKSTGTNGTEIDLTAGNGNGPVKVSVTNAGYLVMQASGKNLMTSDAAGHVGLSAGAANGPANLDTVIAQNQAGETTHNTLALQGIASQTGDLLTGYASGSSTKLFDITIAGNGVFSNLQDTAFGAAGVVLNDASGNLSTLAGGTINNVLTWNGSAWVSQAPSASGGAASVLTKTANYTVVTGDFDSTGKRLMLEANCSSDCTITLPGSSTVSGYDVKIINISTTSTVTVSTNGSDTFGSTADTTWTLLPSGNPQSGNTFIANGGTRWDGF